jgi:hypothetical protein
MTDSEATQRLEVMISHLRAFRRELADAEQEGFHLISERAREEIRNLRALIRRHCDRNGIPLPKDVLQDG